MRKIKNKVIDYLAVVFSNFVLLESEAQKNHFNKRFGVKSKYKVVYTGADESNFFPVDHAKENFKVLFRGSLTPESGIFYILKAAELLKSEADIIFRIIGRGFFLKEVGEYIKAYNLSNVEFISEFLPIEELRIKIAESNLSLGQFETNPRLDLTIPHKAYESFAMKIPYLSGQAPAIQEILTDGQNGFLCDLGDPESLAAKIKELSKQQNLLDTAAKNAFSDFQNKFTSTHRAELILELAKTFS